MSNTEKMSRKQLFTFYSNTKSMVCERNEKVILSQQKEAFLSAFT